MFLIMKKFVGNVNGTSFDNEEEFNKAAEEAIKAGGKKLDISSYSYFCDDDEKKEETEEKKEDNFVHTYEFYLGTKEPDEVLEDGTVRFNVPDELVKRIGKSINKESIKEKLKFHLGTLGDTMTKNGYKIDGFKKSIAEYTERINKLNDAIKDVEKDSNLLCGKYNYYYNLLTAVNKEPNKEETVKEKIEKAATKDEVKSSLMNVSVFDFLKQLGFIR